MWNPLAVAVQALTRLPMPSDQIQVPTRQDARRAVALFPLVGALGGVLLAAAWVLGNRVWPGQPLVPAALTFTVGLLLTGGRGLGGVARAADGLAAQGAGGDRARGFAVMRDARRGTTGLVALAAAVALRLAFLAALPADAAWPALVLAGALGGWAVSFAFSAFPVAAADEHGSGLSEAGPGEFLAASAVAIICLAVLPHRGVLAMLAVALAAGPTARAASRRMGGLNAPLCAALGEIAEIAALAALSIR
jgi:cobalamin synthase